VFQVLLFVPILIAAAFIGYYQFILPNGIAAVVNGGEIREAELDSAVERLSALPAGAG
jgi:hypothetical protein